MLGLVLGVSVTVWLALGLLVTVTVRGCVRVKEYCLG